MTSPRFANCSAAGPPPPASDTRALTRRPLRFGSSVVPAIIEHQRFDEARISGEARRKRLAPRLRVHTRPRSTHTSAARVRTAAAHSHEPHLTMLLAGDCW